MTFLFPDSEKHKYDLCFKIQSLDIVCWKEELETPGRSDGKQMTYQFLQKKSQVLSSGFQAHPPPTTPIAVLWLCPVVITLGMKSFKHRLHRALTMSPMSHLLSYCTSQSWSHHCQETSVLFPWWQHIIYTST